MARREQKKIRQIELVFLPGDEEDAMKAVRNMANRKTPHDNRDYRRSYWISEDDEHYGETHAQTFERIKKHLASLAKVFEEED